MDYNTFTSSSSFLQKMKYNKTHSRINYTRTPSNFGVSDTKKAVIPTHTISRPDLS